LIERVGAAALVEERVDDLTVREMDLAGARAGANAQVARLASVEEDLDELGQAHFLQRPRDTTRTGALRALIEERFDLRDEDVRRRGLRDVVGDAELERA